jgi:hypothetical protein
LFRPCWCFSPTSIYNKTASCIFISIENKQHSYIITTSMIKQGIFVGEKHQQRQNSHIQIANLNEQKT